MRTVVFSFPRQEPKMGEKTMTSLDFVIAAVKEADQPCICEVCRNWCRAGDLHPINGSISERAFFLGNPDKQVEQTIWICSDCYDQNN